MSISVEYSPKELVHIIMLNTLKMLERRKLIKSWEDSLKKLDDFTKNEFEIELLDKTKYGIYMITAKLSSIVQKTPLDEYLSNNVNTHKIIIARDVAKKVVKQIVNEYTNAEFFFENELLEDIPSKFFIPEHQLLIEDEKAEVLSKFGETELAKILVTDAMARHFGAKVGDIFRIIRPSTTAGKNIFYRRVTNGSWDILFSG